MKSCPPSLQSPLISVITIVYNDITHIIETMDSVVMQSYPHIEYIIIDGASSDGTREKILAYITACAENSTKSENGEARIYLEATHKQNHLCFKFLSQKDSGIYEAMNRGVDLATGRWCNFMNCGDRFYADNAVEKFFAYFLRLNQHPQPQIIYGDTQLIYDKDHSKILYASTKPHKYKHRFIHQSAFIDTTIMQAYHYDTRFTIAGDTDFFAKAYNHGLRFHYIPLVVSSFSLQGVSSSLSWQMFQEDCQIGYKYNRLFPVILALQYIFWIIPRACIRKLIPARFRSQARILFGKRSS